MDPMSSATDNAVELKRNLSIAYNRERQGKITVEILEIEEFQKSIEEWSQTQPTSEDGTMVKPSPAEMNNMWTSMVGGPKKGRICGTGVLQSSSTLLLFPSSSSTLRTVEEMEAMKNKLWN
ncbi:hypothetical protein T459_35695 [Capsicum annuum]|uniref:Uncharacterized protein n=1 Tax=Capsicum annuum TaxID=4072 RepID=A0A2G2VQW1_CAPAN|nr:hypothetical protein T459_35695 [Capsicum annuum]